MLTVKGSLIHVESLSPALAVGAGDISRSISSVSGLHEVNPFAVNVSVTVVPSSPTPGVYVGVKVFAFVKLPLPLCVQLIDE